MKKLLMVATVALAGCTTAQTQTATTDLATLCAAYAPQAAALAANPDPTIKSLVTYANSACSPATGAVLTTFTADATSGQWLQAIITGLGIVLPLV